MIQMLRVKMKWLWPLLLTGYLGMGFVRTEQYIPDAQKVDPRVEAKVDKLLSKMTLEEKVGQMCQVTLDVITKGPNQFSSDEPLQLDTSLVRRVLVDYKVGSVLNTANNRARTPQKWNEIISQLQEVATKETRLGIPIIYGIDGIHGATYTAGATIFPQEIAMAATRNRTLVRKDAEVSAYETRACGIPWTFSPVLDLGIDPRWPRMWETFGEDPYLVAQMGYQMIKGYEGENNDIDNPVHVASCMKHFLGYSAAKSGKDRTPAWLPEIDLRERHLVSFKKAIDAGAHTVMVNSGIINGVPVHASYDIITKLLKQELGFNGLVVTDWADIENLHNRDKVAKTQKEAVKMAINAGIDMSMVPYNFDFCDYLTELVKNGEVPMSRIDDAVRRILRVKFELGLFKTPVTRMADYPDFASKKFENDAYEAAAEAITLLRNKNQILPLSANAKILVTGPNANSMRTLNGGWTYSWQGEKVDEFAGKYNTILEAIKKHASNVTYVPGVEYKMDGTYNEEQNVDIDAAVKAAADVDAIVLCLGENTYTEKPGDLNDLYISDNQTALAKALAATGKTVILVLNEGRPRLISKFADQMQAILQIYLPGNFGGEALADVLYGKVNPSGKLPYTYPCYPNSLVVYNHKPSEAQKKMEGMYNYEGDVVSQFPFGAGLSYTEFSYSDLKINKSELDGKDNFTISVTVKNTGDREGKETVQLYISDLYAFITPDVKRLRGFEKVDLKPGEEKTVTFHLNTRDLAFVNHQLKYVVEKGKFVASVANLTASFSVKETQTFDR